jgi:hypothetical protein
MDYQETFTAFVDLLGFSEGSSELDGAERFKVLQLLLSLVQLRSDFSAAVTDEEGGSRRFAIQPAISTFSTTS